MLGKNSTAEEALEGRSLEGKTAIVTGATSGIGVETARVLVKAGASVTLAVRSVEAGESLKAAWGPGVQVAKLDLADLESVRAFARAWGEQPVDLLINNAGIMGAGRVETTVQGFEAQLGTNHLGPWLLTQLLMPALSKSSAARVVNVASEVHRRGSGERILATLGSDPKFAQRRYDRWAQYGDSKLANILHARALAKRLPPNVIALSLHPGVIITRLTRSMGLVGAVYRVVGRLFTKSIAQGAATTIYAACAPELATKSGAYLNDCHEWQPLPEAFDDALAERVWTSSERAAG